MRVPGLHTQPELSARAAARAGREVLDKDLHDVLHDRAGQILRNVVRRCRDGVLRNALDFKRHGTDRGGRHHGVEGRAQASGGRAACSAF